MFRQQVRPRSRQARAACRAILRRGAPLAYAVSFAGMIAGAAFAVQALVLPRPSSARLLAVQADRWLVQHRVVRSVDRFGRGPRFRATCVETWFGPAPQLPGRNPGALLVTSGGGQLIAVRQDVHEVLRFGQHLADDDAHAALARFELAGCPWLLGNELSTVLEAGSPLGFERTRVDGQVALRFRFADRRRWVELFVDPKTFRPLAVHVAAGWSRIRPASFALAARLVRRFRLLTNPPVARGL